MKLLNSILLPAAVMLGAVSAMAADGETPLKVMSYNIRYVNNIDKGINTWDARRQASNAMILDEDPDIIGFQEPRPQQVIDLRCDLGDKYAMWGTTDAGFEPKTTGYTYIMYRRDRFELKDMGYFWLSPTPDVPSRPEWNTTDRSYRNTVWVKLYDKKAGKDVYFFNTHLPYKNPDNEARDACVRLNVERMKAIAGEDNPVFITGDMNCSYDPNDTRRPSLVRYYEWMHSARDEANNLTPEVVSFNDFGNGNPSKVWNLDHIFYRNITPVDFAVNNKSYLGVDYISDHFPITLTLKY